jgi:hypothetical protein
VYFCILLLNYLNPFYNSALKQHLADVEFTLTLPAKPCVELTNAVAYKSCAANVPVLVTARADYKDRTARDAE